MKRHVSVCAALLFALLPMVTASGQPKRMAPPAEPVGYRLPADVSTVSIPFKSINNHILIPVTINGHGPFDLILDTGMRDNQGVLLWESDRVEAASLEFMPGARVRVGGAGKDGQPVEARMATGLEVGLDELQLIDARAIVAPPMSYPFRYHDGVIGAALFANFVVTINYDQMTITLAEPGSFADPSGWAALPLAFKQGIPYADCSVSIDGTQNIPIHTVVDLGASHPISLNTDSDNRIAVPDSVIQTVIGHGMSGKLTGCVGRIASLTVAGQTITDLIATFPDSPHQFPRGMDERNGNLGIGFLQHFNLIIDYPGERILLQRNARTDQAFEWRTTGFVLGDMTPDGIEITSIVPGSPAVEAGLTTGDRVTAINGMPLTDTDYARLEPLLRQPDQKLSLDIYRDGEKMTVKLVTRRLI